MKKHTFKRVANRSFIRPFLTQVFSQLHNFYFFKKRYQYKLQDLLIEATQKSEMLFFFSSYNVAERTNKQRITIKSTLMNTIRSIWVSDDYCWILMK